MVKPSSEDNTRAPYVRANTLSLGTSSKPANELPVLFLSMYNFCCFLSIYFSAYSQEYSRLISRELRILVTHANSVDARSMRGYM